MPWRDGVALTILAALYLLAWLLYGLEWERARVRRASLPLSRHPVGAIGLACRRLWQFPPSPAY